MKDKISKLIYYIEKTFPEGCGHKNYEECVEGCPLINCDDDTLNGDICKLLMNHEKRTRND